MSMRLPKDEFQLAITLQFRDRSFTHLIRQNVSSINTSVILNLELRENRIHVIDFISNEAIILLCKSTLMLVRLLKELFWDLLFKWLNFATFYNVLN